MIASAQYGRVSRRQLLAAGLTADMIRTRLGRGTLIGVARGVYASGHTASIPYAAEVAALLAMPGSGMLSHLTAARLWRIHEPANDRFVDLLVPNNSSRGRHRIRVHRTDMFTSIRPSYLYELPVTPVPLTLLQIAPLLTLRELEIAVDEAIARGLTSFSAIRAIVSENPKRSGRGMLGRLVADRVEGTGVTRLEAEAALLHLIRQAHLPEPMRNAQIGEFTADFYWSRARVAVEVDSYQWHTVRTNFERDRRKDTAFKIAGIDLTRLTWSAVTRDRVGTAALLARTMGQRERRS